MKSKLFFALTLTAFLTISPLAYSQDQPANQADSKQRARAARELVKQGQDGVPALQRYVTDTDLGVRLEAVKALDDIGGPKTVDALVVAARDPDPEMQIRATDGLVNVYLPGYLKTGISGTLQRAGNSVKAKFTDTNDQVIDAYVEVRPEAIAALGHLASAGASVESRANACRAVGISVAARRYRTWWKPCTRKTIRPCTKRSLRYKRSATFRLAPERRSCCTILKRKFN